MRYQRKSKILDLVSADRIKFERKKNIKNIKINFLYIIYLMKNKKIYK